MTDPVVEVSSGALRGRAIAEGAAFLGVPYAAAPVGPLRYVAPQAAPPWEGVREATAFAPVAPQPIREIRGIVAAPFMGPAWSGEDPELALNVWTPGINGPPKPVIVFIHGGAFVAGAASAPVYSGAPFARDGIVAVTVTYRLGAEGFLALDGGETNVAIRDQLAALMWVQREIAAFGGDPGNVTVCGQSAGAMTLTALLGSPRSRGLFVRSILQSGATGTTISAEQGARVAAFFADALGVPATREAFADVPIADVVAVQARLMPGVLDLTTDSDPDPTGGMLTVLPVRDGDVVPHDNLAAVAAREGSDVALLIGKTTEEGNLYVAGFPGADMAAARPITEKLFHGPIDALTAAHRAAGGAPTHAYEFGWRSGAFGGRLGAAHAVDLPFVFDAVGVAGLAGEAGLLGPDGGPQGLADRMHAAWVGFARDGDPGWSPDHLQQFA